MERRTFTQLNPSKLTTYMTCPVKFYARYILGIKSPPCAGMLLGRAVQKAPGVSRPPAAHQLSRTRGLQG